MAFKPLRLIKKLAVRYKPYDTVLRTFRTYRIVSNWLRLGYFRVIHRRTIAYKRLLETSKVAPNTILFETFWGRSISCNPYAIFQGMAADERFTDWTFIWVKNPNTKIPADVASDSRVTLVDHQSHAYQQALTTTQVLVNNTTFPTHFIRQPEQRYINTYHGIPLKKMGFDIDDTLVSIANTQRNFIQATTLLSGGEYTDKFLYAPYGAMPMFRDRILHSGFPRIDQTQTPASPDFLARLGVTGLRPVLLFAPTWRGTAGAYEEGVSELIDDTAKLYGALGDDFDILVSYHNLVMNTVRSLPETIRLVPADLDINEVMSAVDILISDYSSIMIDFLALDRPLVLYVPDRAQYESTRGLYLDLEGLPAMICNTFSDVVSAVKNPKRPSEFATYQQSIDMLIPNQDGHATRRVLDEIFQPCVNTKAVTKKRLLMNIHSLGANGITSSFLNLLSKIDHDETEIYILLDARAVGSSSTELLNFKKIDPRCHRILRIGQQVLDVSEERAVKNLRDPDAIFNATSKRLKSAAFSREVLRIVSDERFEAAIDFAGYSPFWAHAMAATTANQKVIFQHNDLHAEYTNAAKSHEKLIGVFRAYAEFDTIAPVSTEIGLVNYEKLKIFYYSKGQIKTIRNVINIEKLRQLSLEPIESICPPIMAYRDLPTIKLVTVGRLSSEKNQARLIEAFSQARKDGLDVVLFIAGDGPLRELLMRLIQKLGVSDHVFLLGQVDNPIPLIKAADYFVLSSDYEGQPMTLLEALTLGTHCIGTDIPGIAAVLGQTREIICQPTVDDLASSLLALQKPKKGTEDIGFNAEAYTTTVLREFNAVVFERT
ncbi:MAG: glycosyltransferase [Litoreibacter sp.]